MAVHAPIKKTDSEAKTCMVFWASLERSSCHMLSYRTGSLEVNLRTSNVCCKIHRIYPFHDKRSPLSFKTFVKYIKEIPLHIADLRSAHPPFCMTMSKFLVSARDFTVHSVMPDGLLRMLLQVCFQANILAVPKSMPHYLLSQVSTKRSFL